MSDFIFHIGIEKTGTTTLQSRFFPQLNNYLGISKQKQNLSSSYQEIRWFYDLFKKYSQGENIYSEAARFADYIQKLCEQNGSPRHSLILSYEQLCTPTLNHLLTFPYLDRRQGSSFSVLPIVSFLRLFSEDIWPEGKVKILLTLRRQEEWLGSLYSQMSNRILRASQTDFEQRLDRYMALRGEYIHWSRWVFDLLSCFSRQDVCVLFVEDMSTFAFWRDLSDFINAEELCNEELERLSRSIKNKRQLAPDTWSIRPVKDIARHNLKRKWPADSDSHLRQMAMGFASFADGVCCPVLRAALSNRRDSAIHLTPSVKRKIRSFTSESNRKLSRLINQDLSRIGYY